MQQGLQSQGEGLTLPPVLVQGAFPTMELGMERHQRPAHLCQTPPVFPSPTTFPLNLLARGLRIAQDMSQALLLLNARQHVTVVHLEAVTDQHATEVVPDHRAQLRVRVLGIRAEDDGVCRAEGTYPGLRSVYSPAGVVVMHIGRCSQRPVQRRDVRRQRASITRQTLCGLGDGALSHLKPGGEAQDSGDAALRETDLVMQGLDGGRQSGAAPMGSGTALVRLEVRMRATHDLPAVRTGHHRDVVRGDLHGLLGQITDPRPVVAREDQLADIPTGGAGVGHGDVDDVVLLLGSRRTLVREHAFPSAATGRLRVSLPAPPAVRCGVLALLSLQLLDTLLEAFNLLDLSADLLGLLTEELVKLLFRHPLGHAAHPMR